MVVDGAIKVDEIVYMNLDFSNCGIPEDVRTMSWENNAGVIHWVPPIPNEPITELPQWALNCISVFEAKNNEVSGTV